MDCTIKDAQSDGNKTDKVDITHTSQESIFLCEYNTAHHPSEFQHRKHIQVRM